MRVSMGLNIKRLLFVVVGLVGLVITVVALFYVVNFTTEIADSQEVWGQFGDYFGGVLNPILSFFAFCALVYTVYLQIQAGVDSDKRHDEQLFDGRLFKMLSMNFELAQSIRIYSDEANKLPKVYEGIRAINFSWCILSINQLQDLAERTMLSDEQVFNLVKVRMKNLKRQHGKETSVYIDSAIFILEFIKLHSSGKEQADFAIHALRAQMTSAGRGLLFYYLVCSEQYFKFAGTLMRNSFLDDVTDDPLSDRRNNIYVAASKYYQS